MIQYPHFLFKKEVSASVQDADGNWSKAEERWILHSVCREETNGKGSTIELTDGRTITFSSLVQCPKGTPGIAEGTVLMVCNTNDPGTTPRISAKCSKSSVDQLHTRIWL